ncbi:geranyl transferase [Pseudomaricurvus alkylphenolicus]|uniref:polyprenyl synthetase family protein n=1 Tax=Pseudomaricurvus alkylphenolicus TaxID=1306991 RepID=UPI0014203A51|nr:farnesyl diphosphate synthase [Pseudomaricurvus alkylphenolicus]NIB39130.1 geranyl transferase [Pseudomaricurvus alkylphenolicus]
MSQGIKHYLVRSQERVNRALDDLLPPTQKAERRLVDAMRYSLLDGGKRVRPTLVFAAADALGSQVDETIIERVACSVECIHAYSLIHDDLPAMDDDDLRRGKPTCHIAYDEASAILAGDGLQALAFETLATLPGLQAHTQVRLLQLLAEASGHRGMVAGQAIDLGAVDTQLDLAQLQHMHRLKTGALIRASVLMGAAATESVSEQQLAALSDYAAAIGLAFQVQDDILDVTVDTETLGKPQGADAALNKPTYVSLLGLEGATTKARELHQQALTALESFDSNADTLRQLSAYIIERGH